MANPKPDNIRGMEANKARAAAKRAAIIEWLASIDSFGCVEWPWTLGKDGYGELNKRKASHMALEAVGMPRPPGAMALHSCDNPPCVNPRHLRWGDGSDNMKDMVQRGRAPHQRVT